MNKKMKMENGKPVEDNDAGEKVKQDEDEDDDEGEQ